MKLRTRFRANATLASAAHQFVTSPAPLPRHAPVYRHVGSDATIICWSPDVARLAPAMLGDQWVPVVEGDA